MQIKMLTDKAFLSDGLQRNGVKFDAWEIDQLVEIVAKQSEDPADYSGLGDHGTGVDGRAIGEGDLAGRLDTDDCSILLRLCQLRRGHLRASSQLPNLE